MGSLDLDSDHLLWGALQDDVVRHVVSQLRADADAIAQQVEDETEKAERTDVAPSLSRRLNVLACRAGGKSRAQLARGAVEY